MGDVSAVRSYFDRVGPWFYSLFFTVVGYRASLKYFIRHNHPRLGLRRGMRILDAGIGTGFLAVSLLREAPVQLTVTGLDFSVGMLVGLKSCLRKLDLEKRVRLQLGDMRALPFRRESFDLVASSAAMEYLPEVGEGIAECARVLRSGGKLMIISTRRTFMGKLIAALWKNKTLEPSLLVNHMRQAGIQHVRRLRFPWYFPHVNGWGIVLLGEKAAGFQTGA